MEMRRKTKKIISVGAIIWMLTAMLATGTLESTASSTYTLSTSGSITDATVYIDGTKQAKSTITINAQVLKNGNNYTGEVNYWEVSIWRIDENERPIPSGFQQTVKVNTKNSSISHQREIFTPVSFLSGQNQKTQRFGFSVRAYLMIEDEGGSYPINIPEGSLEDKPIDLDNGFVFLGEVTNDQIFGEGKSILNHFNPTGSSTYIDTNYLKFGGINGRFLFVAKNTVKNYISWDSINESAYFSNGSSQKGKENYPGIFSGVYGDMKKTINGNSYEIRLLTGANINTANQSGTQVSGGEWDDLLLALSNQNSPDYGSLNIGGQASWVQEQSGSFSFGRLFRGYGGISNLSQGYSNSSSVHFSWRPVLELVADPIMYNVTFMDFDGTILKVENVFGGSNANSPSPPIREGYTFTGWNTDHRNIYENLNVFAQYSEDLSLLNVPMSESPESIMVGDGYTFLGEVRSEQLFGNGKTILDHFNPSAGTGNEINPSVNYLKFSRPSKGSQQESILFVAKENVKSHISWESINGNSSLQDPSSDESGVYGAIVETLDDGNRYKIRLLTGANINSAFQVGSQTPGGEWNNLLISLITSNSKYNDASFRTNNNQGNGTSSWTQEQGSNSPSSRIFRGGWGASSLNTNSYNTVFSYYGWRPVLELVLD
jgi:hypothetical protein